MKYTRLSPKQSDDTGFGLIAWLEETRIALPLKGVECRFDVTGGVAGVEIDQIYHQDANRPLDCTYTFPLPAGAAVYRCELHVNGRVIRAIVEEKEAARKIYREQKAAGRRAALVEAERENVFTLSLGNVQPDDLIVVRFAWFQTLDRAGDSLRLLVPTCPGVRYIPGKPLLRAPSGRGVAEDTDQVPDASRITPPRMDGLHPDAAYFSMEGRLAASDVESGTVSSPSHSLCVREKGDTVTVEFSREENIPDRDFVLSWREPKALELASLAWQRTEGGESYALVQLRAPADVRVAEDLAQDFYFLVDRSGSMVGAKWTRTCEALRAFVGLLGARDRVWITLFGSDFQDFAEAPRPAADVLADEGFQRMEALGVAGGTELLPAATHVLQAIGKHSAERCTSVILITDGQVGNEAAILGAFRGASAVTVHTFGIDTAVNDAFLKSLARQQQGGCWLQTPDDDIAGTISSLADRLRRPVLTGVSVHGSWEIGGITCPDLHAREVVVLALRGVAESPVEISGHLPDGGEHRFSLTPCAGGGEAVRLLWARDRIGALLGNGRRSEAIGLARKHNLICEGAAFIAWDEAAQVPIATEEIVQPAMEPINPTDARCSLACDSELDFPVHLRQRAWVSRGDLKSRGDFTKTVSKRLAALRQFFGASRVKQPDALRAAEKAIKEVRRKLIRAGTPEPVVDALLAWVFESGEIDQERFSKIERFAESLDSLPFSNPARARHWLALLDATFSPGSEIYAAVSRWIGEFDGAKPH